MLLNFFFIAYFLLIFCVTVYFQAGSERVEKLRRMLDYLGKRPDSCFRKFLNALRNSGQEHCAVFIEQKYVQGGPTQVSDPTSTSEVVMAPVTPGDDPMGNSSSQDPVNNSMIFSNYSNVSNTMSSSAQEVGFPETLTSMYNTAVCRYSSPVQETSVGRESWVPTVSSLGPVAMEHTSIVPAGGLCSWFDLILVLIVRGFLLGCRSLLW